MTKQCLEINPADVYSSLNERWLHDFTSWYNIKTNSAPIWDAFLNDHNIEILSLKLDSCVMKSNTNEFVVCADPLSQNRSLKIPFELAQNIVGNPYFDKEITNSDLPRINKFLENLTEEDNKTIQDAKEFVDGNKNHEVLLPVKIDCDWNGDPWSPEVDVSDIDSRDTLKYGVDWDNVKDIENKAKQEVLKKIDDYKQLVQKMSVSLKVSSYGIHKHIMGWL